MLHGARTSLSIGFIAQSIALLVGVTLGGMAGYYRGWLDIAVFRFVEIMDCFPPLLLILVAISLFESENNMFVHHGRHRPDELDGSGPAGARRISAAERAAVSAGGEGAGREAIFASSCGIFCPTCSGPILVSSTFGVASAILIESSLSFLGFGMQAPTPSWGDILNDAHRYIDFAWWLAFFPSMAILITIMAYNFVGEGLRDAVDPLKVK